MAANLNLGSQPCADCTALDGRESSVPPHDWLALGTSVAVVPDDPDAGFVEHYLCRTCRLRLQRICRSCVLDGWLVKRSQPLRRA